MEGLARLVGEVHPDIHIDVVDPAAAHRLGRGPLHSGAAKYFREAGLLT
jgi:TRAP-type uncharacterized transport system substrate-binding protein